MLLRLSGPVIGLQNGYRIVSRHVALVYLIPFPLLPGVRIAVACVEVSTVTTATTTTTTVVALVLNAQEEFTRTLEIVTPKQTKSKVVGI